MIGKSDDTMKMRTCVLYLVLVCSGVLFHRCTPIHGKSATIKILGDREIHHEGLWIERNYYATKDGDTVDFYCELSFVPKYGRMNIEFKSIPYNLGEKSDTSIVSDNVTDAPYKRISYKEQKDMIDLFLQEISRQYDMKCLKSIDYNLLTSGALDIEVTKELAGRNGSEVEDVVCMSSFGTFMERLLKRYRIRLEKVFVDKYGFVGEGEFKKHNNMDSISGYSGLNSFLDGVVSLSVSTEDTSTVSQ